MPEDGWLYRGSERLCRVALARTFRERSRGLLGRDGVDGALLLEPVKQVHTFRMRFVIDVAHLDRQGRVLRVATMARNRLGPLVLRSHTVLEAEAGAFDRLGLRVGDQLSWDAG